MKITNKDLKEIIKEEIKNIFGNITLDVDKSFMYSSGNMPYVEINITFPDDDSAQKMLTSIQKMFKTLNWNVDNNILYTQILFNKTPFAQRDSELKYKLQKILTSLEKFGVKLGTIKQPVKTDDDIPTKPELKVVK